MSSSPSRFPKYVDTTQQLLPKSQRQTTGRTKTAFKYSHPIGVLHGVSHVALKHTGKSGLTPVSATKRPITPSRRQKEYQKDKIRYYQTRRYFGFTADHLHRLEALAFLDDEAIVENTLLSPIHPLFARNHWETQTQMPKHVGPAPIRGNADVDWDPNRGYWLAENPLVWETMEPAITLASSILFTPQIYPWWDAFINGAACPIPLARSPPTHQDPGKPLLNIRQRPANIANQRAAQDTVKDMLYRKLPKSVRLRLYSAYENPKTGVVTTEVRGYGVTYVSSSTDYTWINVALEMFQPLLRDDLSEAERMACHFKAAQCLVHETAHALWHQLRAESGSHNPIEPFFQDELLSEVGFSLTDKIFGGEPQEINIHENSRGGPGLPCTSTFKTNWFTYHNAHYKGPNTPVLPYQPVPGHPFMKLEQFPIPTAWTKSLFDNEMWTTNVALYGSAASAMGPLTYGSVANFRVETLNPSGAAEEVSTNFHIEEANEILPRPFDPALDQNVQQLKQERSLEAERIIRLIERPQPMPQRPPSPTSSDEDDGSDFPVVYSCPRFDEIKAYLCQNRHYEQLALDTMDFDMPERTLYRYILDRGGLKITPLEFRNFLYTASERREMFFYAPFPGLGTVTRLDQGWPDQELPDAIPAKRPPNPMQLKFATECLRNSDIAFGFMSEFGEFRDFGYGALAHTLNSLSGGRFKITTQDMTLLANEIARLSPSVLTLGPKGIARMRTPFPQHIRDQLDTPYLAAKRLENQRAREAARLQEQESIQSNSQVGGNGNTGSVPSPSGDLGAASADYTSDGDLSLGSDPDLNDVDVANLVMDDKVDDPDDLDDLVV